MVTEEQKRRVWNTHTKEDREIMIISAIDFFLKDGVSLEQSIQRVIDTFACDHQEVIEAMKLMSEPDLGPGDGSGHPETWGND